MDRMTTPLTSAEVIAVGSELLGTAKLDTNSLFIAGQLGRLGIELKAKSVVGDDRERLADVLRNALTRADLVILTGGLGPTDDDLTREAVADVLGLELVEDPAITARIRQRFERRGMSMPEVNRRQAMVHRGARVLPNPNGSAPGILIETNGRMVVLLPGPPRELQPMLSALCADGGAIAERAGRERLFTASIFTASVPESRVEELVQPIYSRWRDAPEPIGTTILASPGQVEIHLTMRSADAAHATGVLERARAQLVEALGRSVFSTDGRSLPQVVGDLLRERKLTFAAAESCTGGLVLQRMTDIPGSSDYVKGGVVAYSNELKMQLLGVDAALLKAHGAVSEPVAAAMVDGIRERTGAGVCVSITGIAGPGGGSETKPVGTVVIGVLVPGRPLSVRTYLFPGNREMVRLQSSQMALDRVRLMLME
jgi:nicotinamide-nucleotide amidase